MKKIIIVLILGVINTSLISGYAVAQKSDLSFIGSISKFRIDPVIGDKAASEEVNDFNKKGSKGDLSANLSDAKANLKIASHFNRNFENVSNSRWYSDDDIAIAKFSIEGKAAKVVYNGSGKWVYTILSYHEDQLPWRVKSLLKANYSGFRITFIQEISQEDINCYMVYLENDKMYKYVMVYDCQVISDKSLNKSMQP